MAFDAVHHDCMVWHIVKNLIGLWVAKLWNHLFQRPLKSQSLSSFRVGINGFLIVDGYGKPHRGRSAMNMMTSGAGSKGRKAYCYSYSLSCSFALMVLLMQCTASSGCILPIMTSVCIMVEGSKKMTPGTLTGRAGEEKVM